MTDDQIGNLSKSVAFDAMFKEELDRRGQLPRRRLVTLGKATGSAGPGAQDDRPLVGLALSGGGIRSAAFSLGVVQALEAEGIFPRVDYLSTVSGGGYTGAAVVASMIRNKGSFRFAAGPSGGPPDQGDIADSPEIRLIRDRCRYLMPNGLFDLFVSLGVMFRGLVVNAAIISALVFFAASLFLLCYPSTSALQTSWLSRAFGGGQIGSGAFGDLLASDFALSKFLFAAMVGGALLWGMERSIVVSRPAARQRALSDPDSAAAKVMGAVFIALLVAIAFDLQQPLVRLLAYWRSPEAASSLSWSGLRNLGLVLAAATATLVLCWRALVGTVQDASKRTRRQAAIQTMVAKIAIFLLAMALPALIYTGFLTLALAGLSTPEVPRGAAAALKPLTDAVGLSLLPAPGLGLMAALFLWSALIGPIGSTLLDKSWRSSPAAAAPMVGWTGMLVVAAAFAGWPLQGPVDRIAAGSGPEHASLWLYAEITCTLLALGTVFTENANSLHRLYRDRLNLAFSLGSGDGKPFRLHELHTAAMEKWDRRPPQLIINAAVNMQGSSANRRARNADYFVFTGSRVGSDATRYASTEDFGRSEPHVDLATAVAISGAAVSAAMGRASVPLLGPTLALLNIRLGYWLRNPRYVEATAALAEAGRRDWTIAYLALEAFGLLNEERSKVYVTDGGHIDNLGVRELLKRRCDVIVVSDAEADPAMNFAGLVDVERFARIDLGVRIDVPWELIRDAALARSSGTGQPKNVSPAWAHGAVGRINYPARDDAPAKQGLILYVKSSVTGDERSYILDYERRFPRFPHEPTGDQFFTEEQFEAYRALGFHATRQTLGAPDGPDGPADREAYLAELRTKLK